MQFRYYWEWQNILLQRISPGKCALRRHCHPFRFVSIRLVFVFVFLLTSRLSLSRSSSYSSFSSAIPLSSAPLTFPLRSLIPLECPCTLVRRRSNTYIGKRAHIECLWGSWYGERPLHYGISIRPFSTLPILLSAWASSSLIFPLGPLLVHESRTVLKEVACFSLYILLS